jgi:hypothetical protein
MNLCIIGNGATALNTENGNFIDTCDIVIRLGKFVIENYETYVGSKTDIYVSRWYKCKSRPKHFFESIKQLWIPRTYETREKKYDDLIEEHNIKDIIRYIPNELVFSYKARYPFRYIKKNVSKRGNDELYCCIPDSGIVAIDMARHFYPKHNIFICGFDNCSTGYYWDINKNLDTLGDDLMDLQLMYLKSLINDNIVTDLCDIL